MELLIVGGPLRQDSPHPDIRGVHLHYELSLGVGHTQNGRGGEAVLKGLEGVCGGRGPAEGDLGGGEGCERGCHRAVSPNEATVKVGKPQEPL